MKHLTTSFYHLKQNFLGIITDLNFYYGIIKIVLVLVGSRLLLQYGTRAIERMVTHRKAPLDDRKRKTIGSLGTNILRYVVYIFVILMVLEQLGLPMQTLLAGAGVVGIALGFGAQNLVKDVISGFFVILEDQYAVGDQIQTGNYRGTVQDIGLRTTVIRSWTGETHILPNGTITQVTNYSKANSVAIVDFGVAYEEDLQRVIFLLKDEMGKTIGEIPSMLGEPQVLGIQDFGGSSVTVRLIADCEPLKQGPVAQELRLRIKTRFDREGVLFPYSKHLVLSEKTDSKLSTQQV